MASRETSARLAISLGQYSDAGAKPENQDFHGALIPDGALLTTKGIAVALADGISTSRLGREAAETAVKSFLSDYYCTPEGWTVQTAAQRVIAATNSWMHGRNGRPLSDAEREAGMVCTFTAVVLKSRTAHIFHIGDARVVRLRGGRAERLTEEHRVHVGGGESYLARAMGLGHHVEIDYRRAAVEPGDVLVLTTDGVHDFLPESTLATALAAAGHGDCDLNALAQAIAQAALDRGSDDNLTVQLMRVDAAALGELDEVLGVEAVLPPAPLLEPGKTFSGYRIIRTIYSGSRSSAYLARDEEGRFAALKVLSTDGAADPALVQNLLFEDWVMRRLDHPTLLRAAPLPAPRRHAFIASEYIDGQTLWQWMLDNPQPPLETVRAITRQIASGIQAMHRRGMIHRDLRPHNVMIDGDGKITIIDFGSVQVDGVDEVAPPAEGDGAYAGTLQYSAPELYRGQRASERSDLFSLAVITYQMLTGELPYGAAMARAHTATGQRKLRYVPAAEHNPQVPGWVDAALKHALAVDPGKRYEVLSAFLYDLSNPNQKLVAPPPRPLLTRGSVHVWRAVAGLLALALIVSILTRPDLPVNHTHQKENAR